MIMGSPKLLATGQRTSRLRQVVVVSVGLLALYVFLRMPEASLDSSRTVLDASFSSSSSVPGGGSGAAFGAAGSSLSDALLNNRFLTASQCTEAFPGLTKEIDDVVTKGTFKLEKSGSLGPLVARIKDGELSILQHASRSDLSRDMLAHRTATLHQIHSALLTWPPGGSVPDTVFAFSHHDSPSAGTFSYSRPADPARNGAGAPYFPVPHFSHWAWPLPFVRSLPHAAGAIAALERRLGGWRHKEPRAVWRGTPHFNSPSTTSARLRQDLLLSAAGRPWADIEALAWTSAGRNASNALPIADFCRYRYIVHTEGITYSGRLQFHQLCQSVILTPPISWMQHTSHLIRPVFSSSLPGVERRPRVGKDLGGGVKEKVSLATYPAPWVQMAWGKGSAAEEANMVFVAPDWSDLESTVLWLEKHPRVAEGIARRQREVFHGAGYLSPAAEMCYWRAAIRGWSQTVDYTGQGFEELEGIPFEEFILTEAQR
ncbi:hypothetical protein JX265_002867 [Neoarthrinium moseri]|uniref:Glycosyl transferase CAP10 domain-containing protein n=1 Tax=Neoarthrinium moseri TaxID=1658444 RepID=A0A9P9WTJ0_9PEZI|nr:hypothetical protein JX265_002867 [Neoarthrinium moseri]